MALKPLAKTDYDTLHPTERNAYISDSTNPDRFVPNIEGGYVDPAQHAAIKAKNDEFRDTNRGLNTKVTELEGKLAAAEAKLAAPASTDADERIAAAEAKAAAAEAARAASDLRHEVSLKFRGAGGQEGAEGYAVTEAEKRGFRVEGGTVVCEARSTKAPGSPLGLDEFLDELQGQCPFLFKPSKGGGSPGGPQQTRGDNRPTIDRHDVAGFSKNLEAIAAGNVLVR